MSNNFDCLTKEHKKVICCLYKTYIERRKNKENISQAVYFDDAEKLHDTLFPDLSIDDISSLCWYLKNKGFLYCESADDMAIEILLNQSTIALMENRFKDNLKQITDFIFSLI